MSVKKIYSFDFINKQLFIHKFFILLLFLIAKLAFILAEDINGINAAYPNVLQLHDNKLFISNNAGMFFCDQNLQPFKAHEYYNKTIYDFNDIKDKVLIAQFEEDNNIICLVQNVFYFFKENGDFLLMGEFPDIIKTSPYINLLTYKKDDNNNFHFIIVFMNEEITNLIFYHYMITDTSYEIVFNSIYFPFYFDYPNIHINNKYFTCQILLSEKKGNILTCCINTYNSNLIVLQSFEIENNFREIEEYYAKTPIESVNIMSSTRSADKKYILVCYSPSNFFGYCFNYDFDSNQIQNNKALIEECSDHFTKFKVNYYKEKREYIFICEKNDKFTIIFFDKDFNLLNPNEITAFNFQVDTAFYSFNSISVIYDTNEEKYAIIGDPIDYKHLIPFTRKIIITTNFSQNFSSNLEKPKEFEEIPPDQDLILKETSRYYVYTNEYKIVAKSNKDKKMYIDLKDEEKLFMRTKTNESIDTSLYSFSILLNSFKGNLTAEVDGIEKKIIANVTTFLTNITHLNFYPIFDNENYIFSFLFTLYLKNKTLASEPALFSIFVCRENCSCTFMNLYCMECLENFSFYETPGVCVNNSDLKAVYFDSNRQVYLNCYQKCKECSGPGYSDYQMNCLSCYEEYGDYFEADTNKCLEKYCENLYYRDKDTNMKTCINETICPVDYPYLNEETKQCMHELIQDSTYLAISTTQNFIPTTKHFISTTQPFIPTTQPFIPITHPFISTTQPFIPTTQPFISTTQPFISSTQPFIPTTQPFISTTQTYSLNNQNLSTISTISFDSILVSTATESSSKNLASSKIDNSEVANSDKIIIISQVDKTEYSTNFEETQIVSSFSEIDEEVEYQKIMDYINGLIDKENIDEINKTYSILSDSIKNSEISSFKKDVTLNGENITYQITTSENQKKASHNLNVSVIDLGECEKIIKRNISKENDPTPLLILKIDIKKSKTKTTAVEYEVYNPYTREKIDLSICINESIAIYAPVNLNDEETSLYNDLSSQGYDLFDVNNSFYTDSCATYTSSNGTDVSLLDRKDYYYNEDIVLCEDKCEYMKVDTKTEKVFCKCKIKNEVNIENNQEFSPQKLIESFYKVDTILNFEVLFCFDLVFSKKGLKQNICFYILIIFFAMFLVSMIINVFTAMKKIDEIIFKIFQDKFMYYFLQNIISGGRRTKRNAIVGNDLIMNNAKIGDGKQILNLLQRQKFPRNKNLNNSSAISVNSSLIKKKKFI